MTTARIVEEYLPDAASAEAAGARIAPCVAGSMVIGLVGELGAGKTTLVRGLLRALGVEGPIKSPTFTLVEVYKVLSLYLYHFDFYRFESSGALALADLRDYFRPDAACLIEWPERAGAELPLPDLVIELGFEDSGRRIRLTAHSPSGERCVARFKERRRQA